MYFNGLSDVAGGKYLLEALGVVFVVLLMTLLIFAAAFIFRLSKRRYTSSMKLKPAYIANNRAPETVPGLDREQLRGTSKEQFTVFVSGVTADFDIARKDVQIILDIQGFNVIEQTVLDNDGIERLLDQLISRIRHSDVVVSLIGKSAGFRPRGKASAYYNQFLPEGLHEPSYTQWEVLIARYYDKPVFYVAQNSLFDREQTKDLCQKAFLEYLDNCNIKWKQYNNHRQIPGIVAEWVEQRFALQREQQVPLPPPLTQHLGDLRQFSLERLRDITRERIDVSRDIGLYLAPRLVRSNGGPDAGLPAAIEASVSAHTHNPEKRFDRMLVLAEAGDGKTTLIHWLLALLADNKFVYRSRIVPILADCVTLSRLMRDTVAEDGNAIADWLSIAVSPANRASNAGSSHVEDFMTQLRDGRFKLLILVDGLDELDPAGTGSDRAERLFQALEYWRVKHAIPVEYFATSRRTAPTSEQDVNARAGMVVGLRAVQLLPVSKQAVKALASKRLSGADEELLGHFAEIFHGNQICSKLFYFVPLIRFFQKYPDRARLGDVTDLDLIRAETDHVVSSLREDLLRHGDGHSLNPAIDEQISFVLLDIALMSLTRFEMGLPTNLSRRTLEARFSVTKVPGLVGLIRGQRSLVERLLHILVYVSRDAGHPPDAFYRLPHNEYRDYLLANGIFGWIRGTDKIIGISGEAFIADLASSYLGAKRVPVFLKAIIDEKLGQEGSIERQAFARSLTEKMNGTLQNRVPAERTDASPHGAMLSLLMSLGPLPAYIEIEAANRCFQRAVIPRLPSRRTVLPLVHNAKRANFSEADLRGCDMRGRDFTGAIFDNALLNGASLVGANLTNANLRNVAMGSNAGFPTDLTGATLDGSDWFNYRFQDLKGYFHFWDLEPIPERDDEDSILASASRGQLLAFNLTKPLLPPEIIQTSHVNEVMDLSLHPTNQTLVSTSRDATVRLFDVATQASDAGRLTLTERTQPGRECIFEFTGYPRRAQFSSSGKWMAVIARDPRVVFFHVAENNALGDPIIGHGHTGPVMCIVADQAQLLNPGPARSPDIFLTAGYDGRVAVWSEDFSNAERGWSQPLAIVSEPATTRHGGVDIFRALAVCASGKGLWAGTELESRLLLFRFDGTALCYRSERAFAGDGGIFALAVNQSPSRIAVGFANGRVKVFEALAGTPDEYDWDKPLLDISTSGEIVRSLMFRREGSHVVVATWDACLFQFDLVTGRAIGAYEFPVADWEPEFDTGQIWFNPDDRPLKRADGLSDRMKNYLMAVNEVRLKACLNKSIT